MGVGCVVDRWGLVAECGVPPAVVVVCLPVADHHPRLRQWPNRLMLRAPRCGATPGAAARPARGRRDARRGDGWMEMSSPSGESRSRVSPIRRA